MRNKKLVTSYGRMPSMPVYYYDCHAYKSNINNDNKAKDRDVLSRNFGVVFSDLNTVYEKNKKTLKNP